MLQPARKGSDTRERILDVAEPAILEKGFGATSIEELIAAVGITKSGFFYHFPDKNALAKALLVRYVEREDELFDALFARADALNEDPLHGFLVGLKMMSELMAECLAAIPVASSPRFAIRSGYSTRRCATSTPRRCSTGASDSASGSSGSPRSIRRSRRSISPTSPTSCR